MAAAFLDRHPGDDKKRYHTILAFKKRILLHGFLERAISVTNNEMHTLLCAMEHLGMAGRGGLTRVSLSCIRPLLHHFEHAQALCAWCPRCGTAHAWISMAHAWTRCACDTRSISRICVDMDICLKQPAFPDVSCASNDAGESCWSLRRARGDWNSVPWGSEYMSLELGDFLLVWNDLHEGWAYGISIDDNTSGWFPPTFALLLM